MLTDWSSGTETRNYKIQHRLDKRSFFEMLGNVVCILMIAGTLVGYVAIRSQIIALGYDVQKLKEQENALQRVRNTLVIQEEYLKSPERIDSIARNELGMEPLSPYQHLVRRFEEAGTRSEALALAGTSPAAITPKRPSISN